MSCFLFHTGATCTQSETDVLDSFSQEQQKKIIHHFLLCKKRDCTGLSSEEKARIKTTKKAYVQSQSYLWQEFGLRIKNTTLVARVRGRRRAVLPCLQKIWFEKPPKQEGVFFSRAKYKIKKGLPKKHIATKRHKDAITTILLNRLSVLQKQLDHNAEVRVDVYQRVFYCLYWLAKEEIANMKALSLLKLVEKEWL